MRFMEWIPSTTFTKEKRMDGTTRYGRSSSSSSSVKFHNRLENPVANQGNDARKETDLNLAAWEVMEGDNNSPHQKKDDVDDGNWELVENDKVMSGQKKADADFDDWEVVEYNDVLPDAHKLATLRGNADSGWSAADPSLFTDGDNTDVNGAWHHSMSDPLAYLQQLISEDALADTPDAIRLQRALKAAHAEYNDLMREARKSNHAVCSKEIFFNFLSGANAFLMCFGAGTLTSSAVGIPLAGWAMSTALWALTERISPMIRNTTWSNPHADKTYPLLGNLIQHAARDLVRQIGGMQARKSTDEHSASDGSDVVRLSDINVTGFLKAWLGKMSTEDLPYYFYTLCYGTRYSIIARMNWPVTSFASLSTLLLAGVVAGASTATTTHFLRRQLYEPSANGNRFNGQIINKTMAMWKKQLAILDLYKQLFSVSNNALAIGQPLEGNQLSQRDIAFLNDAIHKAEQKSRFMTSVWFEMKAMFNLKRDIADPRGEVAGKLSEFLAGFLAKASVLGISTGWNYGFTIPMLEATASAGGKVGIMWGQYGMLIVAFNARKEFELAYRGVLGLGLGTWDVCSQKFACLQTLAPENAENKGYKPKLPSTNSTTELMANYKQRTKRPKKASKHRGAMDGGDEDASGNNKDNLGNINTITNDDNVTVATSRGEQEAANGGSNGNALAKNQKRERVNSSSSPRNVSKNANQPDKPDTADTADERNGTTLRAQKNKSLLQQKRDVSDSSDSSD
jgi:hypothetical protein